MSRPVPVLAALALALAGCPGDVEDPFPKSVGFQPLTYCPEVEVAWPDQTVDPCPEILNVAAWPRCSGYINPDQLAVAAHAHGRGFYKASIMTVWSKMRPTQPGLPNWIHLCDDGTVKCVDRWEWRPGLEGADFPVSFRMGYHVDEVIPVDWEHTWREGPLEGTVAAPQVVGARYQKTSGIQNIRVQTGSFVLRKAPDDTCTSIELVGWLSADTQGQSQEEAVTGTLRDAYGLLSTGVHTTP